MKKLTFILVAMMLVSCGKHEIVESAKKEFVDGVNTTFKAFEDSINTGGKAISDSIETSKKAFKDVKREFDQELTEIKETTYREGHNGIKNGSKFVEGLGQVPRKIGNKLLGTSEDSNEDVNSIEKNLQDLENELDELESEFWESFAELSGDMDEMKIELQGENQELQEAIDEAHSDLLRKIKRGDKRNKEQIRALKNKVRELKYNVREIRRHVNNLEVVCEYLRLGHRRLVEYCELSSEGERER